MKHIYFLALSLVFVCSSSFGQSYTIGLGSPEVRPCEFDTLSSINAFSNVRIYSTLDDTRDGPVDSSLCYSLVLPNNRFPLASVPTGRSVFFEVTLQEDMLLDTSTVYLFQSLLQTGCFSWGCESVHFEMMMPDSSGTDTVVNWKEYTMNELEMDPIICFTTQKIENQRISRVVVELSSINGSYQLNLYSMHIGPMPEGTRIIPQLTLPEANEFSNLVRYWHDIYPRADSISYTDVQPWGNPSDSMMVQYFVPWNSSLHFQDFTALRGALVNGSDSVRHGLEVILEGNICFVFSVEIFWDGGTSLVIDGGTIGMHGSGSCNQFGKGGTLRVRAGSDFQYGNMGVGMLALRTDAHIIIESGASMTINGPVFIYEFSEDLGPQQLYMELPIGANLSFGYGSSISNEYSKDGTMKLNIFMRGGTLDLSGLSAEDQQLINLIYDAPSVRSWENLTLFPNPATDDIQLSWVADKADEKLSYELVDVSGKLVGSEVIITANSGHNLFQTDISSLRSGVYILKLMKGDQVLARKRFVKQ